MYNQLRTVFHNHFVPHQFDVATPSGAETVIHVLRAALDLHLDLAVFQVDAATGDVLGHLKELAMLTPRGGRVEHVA